MSLRRRLDDETSSGHLGNHLAGGAVQLGVGEVVVADIDQGSSASRQPQGHLLRERRREGRKNSSSDFVRQPKVKIRIRRKVLSFRQMFEEFKFTPSSRLEVFAYANHSTRH